jgi:hypothetical protein
MRVGIAAWCPTEGDGRRTALAISAMLNVTRLLAVVILFAGCVSFAELAKDADVRGPVPPNTRSVVIYPTVMEPAALTNADGLADAPQLFARLLRDALQEKRPSWDIRLIATRDPIPELAIAVTTELLKIDGGSAGLRFWIGLGGTGAAVSTVRVSVLDKTRKTLASARISESSECPVGACIESNESAIQRNLTSLAGEVAEFVLDPAEYVKKKQ